MALILKTTCAQDQKQHPISGYDTKDPEKKKLVFTETQIQEYLKHPDISESNHWTCEGHEYYITEWAMKPIQTCWELSGFDESDYELAEHLGIVDPVHSPDLQDEIEFYDMMEKQEEFFEDKDQFLDELEFAKKEMYRECEVIQSGKVYEMIPVRICIMTPKYAIGSIYGEANVYIPINVIRGSQNLSNAVTQSKTIRPHAFTNKLNSNVRVTYGTRSIGELCLMNLIYSPRKPNSWKAIYIHPKPEPLLKAQLYGENVKEVLSVEIPRQEIGYMVGKNGGNIHRIRKDLVHNHPELKEYFEGEESTSDESTIVPDKYFPKMDIQNKKESTTVDIWYQDRQLSSKNNAYSGLCPIEGVLKKLYC